MQQKIGSHVGSHVGSHEGLTRVSRGSHVAERRVLISNEYVGCRCYSLWGDGGRCLLCTYVSYFRMNVGALAQGYLKAAHHQACLARGLLRYRSKSKEIAIYLLDIWRCASTHIRIHQLVSTLSLSFSLFLSPSLPISLCVSPSLSLSLCVSPSLSLSLSLSFFLSLSLSIYMHAHDIRWRWLAGRTHVQMALAASCVLEKRAIPFSFKLYWCIEFGSMPWARRSPQDGRGLHMPELGSC